MRTAGRVKIAGKISVKISGDFSAEISVNFEKIFLILRENLRENLSGESLGICSDFRLSSRIIATFRRFSQNLKFRGLIFSQIFMDFCEARISNLLKNRKNTEENTGFSQLSADFHGSFLRFSEIFSNLHRFSG